jgi:hypothetical protein
MLPRGFFRGAAYCAANAPGLTMGFITIGPLFAFALYFQQVQGTRQSPRGCGSCR